MFSSHLIPKTKAERKQCEFVKLFWRRLIYMLNSVIFLLLHSPQVLQWVWFVAFAGNEWNACSWIRFRVSLQLERALIGYRRQMMLCKTATARACVPHIHDIWIFQKLSNEHVLMASEIWKSHHALNSDSICSHMVCRGLKWNAVNQTENIWVLKNL